jgi:hypothetical protein
VLLAQEPPGQAIKRKNGKSVFAKRFPNPGKRRTHRRNDTCCGNGHVGIAAKNEKGKVPQLHTGKTENTPNSTARLYLFAQAAQGSDRDNGARRK